jgi:hypothetical protein
MYSLVSTVTSLRHCSKLVDGGFDLGFAEFVEWKILHDP